jgi:diguanylate cyclase (GGDEF)-like protein
MECPVAAPAGPLLGKFFAALCPHARCRAEAQEALSMAASLARLAIETSRLHHDLVHRSEFDLLTDIQNRFSLEKHLESMIHAARQSAGIFGLIYIDLNEFKQVNDRYGHQVGDIYLQQVAQRMKKQLRPADILARLGGDEFAVLVPEVRSRAIVEEITLRLERCFDTPFTLEKGSIVRGSASIGFALYPEDATTKDGLLSTADVAMYSAKKARQRFRQMPSSELAAEAVHEESK